MRGEGGKDKRFDSPKIEFRFWFRLTNFFIVFILTKLKNGFNLKYILQIIDLIISK